MGNWKKSGVCLLCNCGSLYRCRGITESESRLGNGGFLYKDKRG